MLQTRFCFVSLRIGILLSLAYGSVLFLPFQASADLVSPKVADLVMAGGLEGYFYTPGPITVLAYSSSCGIWIYDADELLTNPEADPVSEGVAEPWYTAYTGNLHLYETTVPAGFYYIFLSETAGVLVGVSSTNPCNGYYHYFRSKLASGYSNLAFADKWFTRYTRGCDQGLYIFSPNGATFGFIDYSPGNIVDHPPIDFTISAATQYFYNLAGDWHAHVETTDQADILVLARDHPGYFVPPMPIPTNPQASMFLTHLGSQYDEYLNIHGFTDNAGYYVMRHTPGGGTTTLASGSLQEGETASIRNDQYMGPDETVEVRANKGTVSVSVIGGGVPAEYNYMSFVLDPNGHMQGTDFITRTHTSGFLHVFALENNTIVEVRDAETGALQAYYNIDKGHHEDVNPGFGIWRIRSDKDVTVCVGEGSGGTFVPLTQNVSGSLPGPPRIVGVKHNPLYPRTSDDTLLVTWLTDENATTKLNYKIGDEPWSTLEISGTRTQHSRTIDISSLDQETMVRFKPESTDLSGNTTIDNNDGADYVVTVQEDAPSIQVTLTDVQGTTLRLNVLNSGAGKAINTHVDLELKGMQPYTSHWSSTSFTADYSDLSSDLIVTILHYPLLNPGEERDLILDLKPFLSSNGSVDYRLISCSAEAEDEWGHSESWSFPGVTHDWDDLAIEQSLAETDYVVLTNLMRFFTLFPQDSPGAQSMPRMMAKFARERGATLVYMDDLDFANPNDIRSYIRGRFNGKVDSAWEDGGYLLLVGCPVVIPSFSMSLSCTWGETYSMTTVDNKYANLNSDGLCKPELCIGRITGDHPDTYVALFERALTPIHIDKAITISGRGNGEGSFADNALAVESILTHKPYLTTPNYRLKTLPDGGSEEPFKYFQEHDLFANSDFVYWRDHGGTSSWSGFVSSASTAEICFGEKFPILYSNACLTGRVESSDNLAENFLRDSACVYIGAVEVSPRSQNNTLGKKIANRWKDGQTIGQAFRNAKRSLAGGIHWYTTCYTDVAIKSEIRMYNLYGDPMRGVEFQSDKVRDATTVYSTPNTPISMSIPMYQVETGLDDFDHVTIPDEDHGSEIAVAPEPIVPVYEWKATYAPGIRINDISLVSRKSEVLESGLNLPTAWGNQVTTPGPGDVPSAGFFPPDDFHWDATELPDGSLELMLTVHPFFYNYETKRSKFYQDYSFDIDFVTSTVSMTEVLPQYSEVPIGSDQSIEVTIRNDHPTDSRTVDILLEVSDGVTGQSLAVPPISVEDVLIGPDGRTATKTLVWPTTGQDSNPYQATIRVEDSSRKDEYDVEYTQFRLGVPDIAFASLTFDTETPGVLDRDEEVNFEGIIESAGDIPASGTMRLEILRTSDGRIIDDWEVGFEDLLPGVTTTYSDVWDSSGVEEGRYQFAGVVYHEGGVTQAEPIFFETIRDMRAEVWMPQDVFGHGDKIMLTADRYELDGTIIPPDNNTPTLFVLRPDGGLQSNPTLDKHTFPPYFSTSFIVTVADPSGVYTNLLGANIPGYRSGSGTTIRSFVVTDNPFTMAADRLTCPADGVSSVTVTSGTIYRGGTPAEDGILMTVLPTEGGITSPDASLTLDNVQVRVSEGAVQFVWQSPTESALDAFVSCRQAISMLGEVIPMSGLSVIFKDDDFNQNRQVCVCDILTVQSHEGGLTGTDRFDRRVDLNEDGIIDATDTLIVSSRWPLLHADGEHCSTCIPEPNPFGITLRPVPARSSIPPGEEMVIDIVVDGAENLGGYEFGCVFVGDALEWTAPPSVSSVLEGTGNTQHDLGPAPYDDGYQIGAYCSGGNAGVSGSTTVATLHVQADQYGESHLILSSPVFSRMDGSEQVALRVVEGIYTVADPTSTPTPKPTGTPTQIGLPTATPRPTSTPSRTGVITPSLTPTPGSVPGDTDGDGDTDPNDVFNFCQDWNKSAAEANAACNPVDDNRIDARDLISLLGVWIQ